MEALYCGIDVGSTNIKVVLADERGRSTWIKSVPAPREHDGIGPVTDARVLLARLEDLIIEGWQAAGGGIPLRAIAAAGIGEDGVGVRDDLTPTCLAIPWLDRRAMDEVSGFEKFYPEYRFDFYTSAAKWRWIARNRPEDLTDAKLWITTVDYPGVYWCGEPFLSEGLAGRTACFDVRERRWIPELLDYASAPKLPRVLKAGQVAGRVRWGRLLEAGAASNETLVVAGGHDHPLATSVILRLAPHARIDSLGTANAIYAETTGPARGAKGFGFDICVPALGGPGVGLLGPVHFAVTLRNAYGGEGPVRSLLATPDLGGSSEEGIRFRKLLQEMTEQAKSYLAALDTMEVVHGPIYATGGWARSDALMRLRATMFGEPITVVDEPELVALGAALVAVEGATGKPAIFEPARAMRLIEPAR